MQKTRMDGALIRYRSLLVLLLSLLLAACPSGGSGGNTAPVADAGPDQVVINGSLVRLDGSGSADADGDPLTFLWHLTQKPQGSSATLSSVTDVKPSFMVDVDGDYVLDLVVNDGTLSSSADSVTITAGMANTPPVANAGADQGVPKNVVVVLDGGASRDTDGDTLSYRWAITSMPAGSAATLSQPDTVSPMFLADLSGIYTVSLVVNDGIIDSAPDVIMVTASNTQPVAYAGADQAARLGSVVTLDGSASRDDDHDTLTYRWTLLRQPTGSTASLSGAMTVNPTFIPDRVGDYEFDLVVNDGELDSTADGVVITVSAVPRLPIRIEHTSPGLLYPSLVYEFTYDNAGHVLSEVMSQFQNGVLTSQNTTHLTYDANGHLVRRVDINSSGTSECQVQTDRFGNITFMSCGGGLTVYSNAYTYNADDSMASRNESVTSTLPDGSTVTSTSTVQFFYDEDGKLIEQEVLGYGSDVYEYNSQGFLVKESHIENGVVWFYYLYSNHADGSPDTKTYYDGNDVLRSIIRYFY